MFNLKLKLSFLLATTSFFTASAIAQTFHEVLSGVNVNQQNTNQVSLFLQDDSGTLYVCSEDLQTWHIIPPKSQPISYLGKDYYPLDALKDTTYTFDQQQTMLNLNISPNSMESNTLNANKSELRHPTKSDYGLYFNYDVFGQTTYQTNDDNSIGQQVGGFFTPNIFTPYGTLTGNFVAQYDHTESSSPTQQLTRLNTTWQTDFPTLMKTLRLGDAYSTPGMWGRSVDFGGIQWGTNFSTQPYFLTFPTLSTSGQAKVPTSVDLYVNNALVSSSDTNAGPFTINNIPTVNGAGTVNVVTTDILGRQQVINVPYYTSTSLLKQGLNNYSLEAGFIREDYGTESNSYGDFMTVATDQYGITNNLTSEVRIEALADQQTVGAGATYLLGKVGVVNAAVAASNSDSGEGGLVEIGFQRQSLTSGISFGLSSVYTSDNFMQTGFSADEPPPEWQNQVFVSFPIKTASLGVSFTQEVNRGTTDDANILNLSYSQSFFGSVSFSANAYTNVYGPKNRALLLTLSKTLSDRTVATVSGNAQENNNDVTAQVTRSLPTDTGYGYNLLVTEGTDPNYQGSFTEQTDYGTYTASAGYQNDTAGVQVEAQGSVVILDSSVFLTRTIDKTDSLAVIDVPGFSDVTIYNNNSPITTTNSSGKAVVTNLLAYQDNTLEIQPSDLPLNTTIDKTKINVVPYSNSGLVVKFPVKTDHPATFTLIDSVTGIPIPVGAAVNLTDAKNKEQYFVVNDGQVYIPNLAASNVLQVTWGDNVCQAKVTYPNVKDPLPDLGKIICEPKL
jgi:outer membrane usher protein